MGEVTENKLNRQLNTNFRKKVMAEHGISKEDLLELEIKKIRRTIR